MTCAFVVVVVVVYFMLNFISMLSRTCALHFLTKRNVSDCVKEPILYTIIIRLWSLFNRQDYACISLVLRISAGWY